MCLRVFKRRKQSVSGGGGGGALFGEAAKVLRHGHTAAIGGGCGRGRGNSESVHYWKGLEWPSWE